MNQPKIEISKGVFVEYKECPEIDEGVLEITTQAQEANSRIKVELWINSEAWGKLKKYVETVLKGNIEEARNRNTFFC